jgi:hypothetical protein
MILDSLLLTLERAPHGPVAFIGDENANCAPALPLGMEQRHATTPFQNILSFPDRLEQEAKALKEQARKIRPGKEREMLLRKARQLETAVHINEWLTSPGLQAPR